MSTVIGASAEGGEVECAAGYREEPWKAPPAAGHEPGVGGVTVTRMTAPAPPPADKPIVAVPGCVAAKNAM